MKFKLFGSSEMDFSRRLTLIMALAIGIIVSVIGTINLSLEYPIASWLGAYGLGVICFVLYGFLLAGKLENFSRWFIMIFFILIVTPYFWIIDGGTMGGFQYFLPTYVIASVVLLSKFGRKFGALAVIIQSIILSIMIYIELVNPELIQVNPDRTSRIIDMGISIWLSGIGSYLMVNSVLKAYDEERHKVERLTIIDDLTQVYNRRYMNSKLQEEIERVERYKTPQFSIILIDIDRFKKVNDTFGHDVGDDALKHLVNVIQPKLRKTDKFARWGGEEFLIFTSQTETDGAEILGERLRKAVEDSPVNEYLSITFSGGISHYEEGDDVDSLTKRADKGLYASKEKGRNQLTVIEIEK